MKDLMERVMKKSSIGVCILYFLALVLIVPNCGKKNEIIYIGVCGPMTGAEGKMGQDLLNGVNLAIEEWNGKGGLLGRRIEILPGDDRSDPKEAVAVANKLVNGGAVAVIGHFNSFCSIPASNVYHNAMIPQITPASTNPRLTLQGFKNVFRICGTDDQQGKVEALFVAGELKAERVAIIHDKTTYGQGLADFFRTNLPASGIQVVAYEGIIKGDKDFSAVLTKVKEQNPEVIMFGGIYPEAGLLVKQMRELGIGASFVSGDGVIDPEFLHIGGKATEGSYLSFAMIGPTGEITSVASPKATKFIESYRAKYGQIGPYSIYSYDAANIIFETIERIGTTDGERLSDAIHQGTFDEAVGQIEFDEKGDVKKAPYIIWVVKEGKFLPYAPAATD
jgi:branched-chain amino acid transport system substrate-binding protein